MGLAAQCLYNSTNIRRERLDTIFDVLLVTFYVISSIFIWHHISNLNQGNGLNGIHRSPTWTYIDSAYFMAQTMSTVGTGDIVPAGNAGSRIFAVYQASSCACYVVTCNRASVRDDLTELLTVSLGDVCLDRCEMLSNFTMYVVKFPRFFSASSSSSHCSVLR